MAHYWPSAGQDAEDELIPEPVYFRLGDRKMEDIENQILGEEEEEDLSDTEMEVTDLTAPPSQAYVTSFALHTPQCTRAAELVHFSGVHVLLRVGGSTAISPGRRP